MKIIDYILFIAALLLLAFILIEVPMVPSVVNRDFDSKKYTDSIKKLNDSIILDEKRISSYEKTIDSLKALPPKIKIKYNAQKSKIPNATVVQLDSIIRSNAGLPQR